MSSPLACNAFIGRVSDVVLIHPILRVVLAIVDVSFPWHFAAVGKKNIAPPTIENPTLEFYEIIAIKEEHIIHSIAIRSKGIRYENEIITFVKSDTNCICCKSTFVRHIYKVLDFHA